MVTRSRSYVLALGVAWAVAGCGGPATLADAVQQAGVPPDAVVRLADGLAVATRRTGSSVEVVHFSLKDSLWVVQRVAASGVSGETSLDLFTMGGETGEEWNSFVYGVAPDEVSRVTLEGLEGQGGQVAGGAWVIALPDKDLTASELRWRFIDASGAILDSGEGVFPPDT